MIDPHLAREHRDRIARRFLLIGCGVLLVGYFLADAAGVLPDPVSVRWHSHRRAHPAISDRYEEFDPDLCLGVAVGDTRFRLNYANGHAVVTRPLFGVTDWVIPSTFEFQGRTFTVTALDPFAVLNAPGARNISLPPTLRYTNRAEELAGNDQRIVLRRPDGSEHPLPPTTGEEGTLRHNPFGTEQ